MLPINKHFRTFKQPNPPLRTRHPLYDVPLCLGLFHDQDSSCVEHRILEECNQVTQEREKSISRYCMCRFAAE